MTYDTILVMFGDGDVNKDEERGFYEQGRQGVAMGRMLKIFGKDFLSVLILICLALGVYSNSLGNGFLWDDYIFVENNTFIRSWNNFPVLFSKKYLTSLEDGGAAEGSYRPVSTLSHFPE